jgi:hypothetical protein
MSCNEADEIASSVVLIFCAIPRNYVSSRPTTSAQIVPLYIAEA